jgi:O-antigen/teichoic acid export membrane protein
MTSTLSPPAHGQPLFARCKARIQTLFADRLVRNVGWYGLAEFANRFTRLVTTIVLARWLVPQDFGIAAIAITTFEIVRVIAQYGIGQAVVRTPDDKLAATCETAWRASWLVCLAAVAIQTATAALIAAYTGRSDAFWMIICLAAVYLTLPFGQIQAHLIVRANRLHVLAGIAVLQVALDNLLTAALAVAGFGAWAVVLPKLLTAPIWVIGMRRAQAWQRDPAAGTASMASLARFAAPVIGSELLVAARFNLDKVLVGAILGIEALGIYYFVFNAGIGFALSLTGALSASIYPHLAEAASNRATLLARYRQTLVRAVLPVSGVIALQAAAALLYVPIVFGAKWSNAAPLVAILCASAIAKPLFDSAAQLLRADGRPRTEFFGSAALTALSLVVLAAALPHGLWTGVIALSASMFAAQALFAALVLAQLAHALRTPASPAATSLAPSGATP